MGITTNVGTTARPGWRRPVVQFVVVGLLTAGVLALVTSWLSQRAAVDEAISGAQATTGLLARSIVQPAIPPGLLDREAASVDRFDRLVRHRVLLGEVLRVKIWDADGVIVYSDEARLIDQQFELDEEELEVLSAGGSEAEVSDLDKPENTFERPLGRLLEVYTQVKSPQGELLLFEAYYSYDDVTGRSEAILNEFRPITVGGILVFLALTVPLVWLLARRLDESARDRERLLLIAAQASDTERRRISRDLHDGVVQELAGTSFALAASAREIEETPLAEPVRRRLSQELNTLAAGLRQNLRALRSLLVEIYPPDLGTNGLAAALDDLVGPAVTSGVDVALDVVDTSALPEDVVALLWRTAQECVRNALRHGQPSHIKLQVRYNDDERECIVMRIEDDGTGYQVERDADSAHFGLRGLRDLATEAGGTLTVSSVVGEGTTVQLEVPVR